MHDLCCLHEVADVQVKGCNPYADQHNRQRPNQETHKVNRFAMALGHTGNNNVGRSGD